MKTILLFIVLFCSSSMLFGQEELIKSIGKSAKEKANAKDFNTTRNNKERGNLQDDKKSKEAAPPASAPVPAESAEPAPSSESSGDYQASYAFSSSVTYKIENLKKSGEVQEINYCFGDQVIRMEPKNQDMSTIIDSKNGVMIMLNNKEKTATVMSTKMMEMAMQQQAMGQSADKPAAKVTKTGRTKTILGYKCEEYLIESDNKKTEVWVTQETGIDVSNTFGNMMKTSMGQVPSEAFSEGGMLMEMTGYDAAGKAEVKMQITALSKEAKTVNIGAYKITKL